MCMCRKGAILMLAVVALWATAPALACLTAAPCHRCCNAMATDCSSAVMSTAHPCCELHGSVTDVPVSSVSTVEHYLGLQHTMICAVLPAFGGPVGPTSGWAKADPPRSPSGASTILRI